MKKPRLTTVIFADGTVARRTSVRHTYTHAVTASAEDPALVKAHLEAAAANAAKDIEALKAAAEAGPVIRSRGFSTGATDMFLGKPSWVLFEAFLNYEPASTRPGCSPLFRSTPATLYSRTPPGRAERIAVHIITCRGHPRRNPITEKTIAVHHRLITL